jgi:glyoxylase-like metal-dependent hydrolase (beta-lactamase superfamily II)
VISHWHADHTGGLLSFLDRRSQKVRVNTIVDVHPNRPAARGIAPPPSGKIICQLPRDPSFEEIEAHGGTVEKHRDGHAVAGGRLGKWRDSSRNPLREGVDWWRAIYP